MDKGIILAAVIVLFLIGFVYVSGNYPRLLGALGGSGVSGGSGGASGKGGLYFDHIVIIAMENKVYPSVLGSGTGTSSAPFLTSLLAQGATIPNYHSYGSTASISGCSAGCYLALTSGSDQGKSDGWCPTNSSPCLKVPNIASEMASTGLTSAAFCEDGCDRGTDHFPWISYYNTWNICVKSFDTCNGQLASGQDMALYNSVSSNPGTWSGVSTVGDTELINYLNSANPADLIWLTPNDSHNMHDNSISSGDQYLHSLLVGTGSLASPGAGSILSTSLFTNPSNRAILYIWWDENDPSPNVLYGTNIRAGLVSKAGNYDEFASLRTLESNWGLGTLGDDAKAPVMADLFTGAATSTTSGTTHSTTTSSTRTNSTTTSPPPAGAGWPAAAVGDKTNPPVIIGWGGSWPVESTAAYTNSSNPDSVVFPGERASNQEVQMQELYLKGMNGIRVEFEPACATAGGEGIPPYNATALTRSITIAKHFGLWVIVLYDGDLDFQSQYESCWLAFWKPVIQQMGPLYNQIVWEPLNEPRGIGNDPTTLSKGYQDWINQARQLGDTHWVVAENLCSYACSLQDFAAGYPTVTDSANRVFLSLHAYLDYTGYSGQWSNSTAETVAGQFYHAVLEGTANSGWPSLNTENGVDPLCTGSPCAPDMVVATGTLRWSRTTFHFIQTLVNLYDSNQPQRINWILWHIGSWSDSPGAQATVYGGLGGTMWGTYLSFKPFAVTKGLPGLPSTMSVSEPVVNLVALVSTLIGQLIGGGQAGAVRSICLAVAWQSAKWISRSVHGRRLPS